MKVFKVSTQDLSERKINTNQCLKKSILDWKQSKKRESARKTEGVQSGHNNLMTRLYVQIVVPSHVGKWRISLNSESKESTLKSVLVHSNHALTRIEIATGWWWRKLWWKRLMMMNDHRFPCIKIWFPKNKSDKIFQNKNYRQIFDNQKKKKKNENKPKIRINLNLHFRRFETKFLFNYEKIFQSVLNNCCEISPFKDDFQKFSINL